MPDPPLWLSELSYQTRGMSPTKYHLVACREKCISVPLRQSPEKQKVFCYIIPMYLHGGDQKEYECVESDVVPSVK